MTSINDMAIEEPTDVVVPHYAPFGWQHWPQHPWWSYQFRRALGETQAGGGAVSEVFQAASRMTPGDDETWFVEWRALADRAADQARAAQDAGRTLTARAAWLRATDYYRSAEFFLRPDDERRIETFTRCEGAFAQALPLLDVPGESVRIPYEGTELPAYYLPATADHEVRGPVLVAFGGLDSFKEELYFMIARGVLERGISCLLVDGPGQGGALRRHGLLTRSDYEVAVAACIDHLLTRGDVDPARIAVSGSSLGGYYAARAGSREHRLAAVVSHGAIWDLSQSWDGLGEDFGLAMHIKWVFGVDSMAEARSRAPEFSLAGVIGDMRCPYLVVHGGHDVLGVRQASQVVAAAREAGVDVTLELVPEERTGAEHCQHDNPTLGMEIIGDWLSETLGAVAR